MTARKKALATGRTFYTGVPCKHGHTLRYAKDRNCVECRRLKCRRFMAKRWADNRELECQKLRESHQKHRTKRLDGMRRYSEQTLAALRVLQDHGIAKLKCPYRALVNRGLKPVKYPRTEEQKERNRKNARSYYWRNKAKCLEKGKEASRVRVAARKAIIELGIEI